MNQKLSVVAIAFALSACGSKTTTYDYYPLGKPEPGYIEYKNQGNSGSMGGILGSKNLDFEIHYRTVFSKKTDGTIINEAKVRLPDVEVVMHPAFTADDNIAAFLSEKGAVIPSKGEGAWSVLAVEASMPSSKLKKVVHTPAFEQEVLESDVEKIRGLYKSVFNESKLDKSLVVVPAWKDSEQSAETIKRLYDLLFNEALTASKDNPNLNIKLFASNREQEDFMNAAWDVLDKNLNDQIRTMKWSATGKDSSSSQLTKLSTGSEVIKTLQGSFTIGGVARAIGSCRLMGVMAKGSTHQYQSTLMVGVPVGQFMIAVGTELGVENKALNYSTAKLWGLMNVSSAFKLSGGISAIHEKVSIFRSELNRYGAMAELGAHYSELISSTLKVSIDAGLRGVYPGAFEMGWFGQVSLDSDLFKATAFTSSHDFGVSFGVER